MTLQEALRERVDTAVALEEERWVNLCGGSLMVSVKTRRLAVPVVVACVGVLGSATAAHAQSGGLSVTPASLQASTADIGATQGALRGAHLRYHLSTLEVLTPEPLRRYGELRGYGGSHGHHGSGHN